MTSVWQFSSRLLTGGGTLEIKSIVDEVTPAHFTLQGPQSIGARDFNLYIK